jgi:Domain of unknown function (DUF4845)
MNATAGRQRGIGFVGMILVAAGLIFAAILAMKMVPAYIHSAQISEIFRTIAEDPAMRGATIRDIKESYMKRADIDYINDITADDISIVQNNGELVLSASYSVRIPIAGNMTLLLEFHPSSS